MDQDDQVTLKEEEIRAELHCFPNYLISLFLPQESFELFFV